MTAPEMSIPICECAAFWESHHPDCPVRRRIESLQRENEELKAELAARTHNYEYWREYAESLKSAAMTPDMREKGLALLNVFDERNRFSVEDEMAEWIRDLLGEQG